MLKLIKYLLFLAIIGAIVVVIYALFFELPAPTEDVDRPIELSFD